MAQHAGRLRFYHTASGASKTSLNPRKERIFGNKSTYRRRKVAHSLKRGLSAAQAQEVDARVRGTVEAILQEVAGRGGVAVLTAPDARDRRPGREPARPMPWAPRDRVSVRQPAHAWTRTPGSCGADTTRSAGSPPGHQLVDPDNGPGDESGGEQPDVPQKSERPAITCHLARSAQETLRRRSVRRVVLATWLPDPRPGPATYPARDWWHIDCALDGENVRIHPVSLQHRR